MMSLRTTPLDGWIENRIGPAGDGCFDREHLRRYQLEQIRRTLTYAAACSPFYRRRLGCTADFAGLDWDGFAALPFTASRDLCRDPLAFLCISSTQVARVVTLRSSGTTGMPKRLFFDEPDLERTIDFFRCGMSTLVQTGQRVLILMPGESPGSVGDLLVRGLARMGVEGLVHGPVRDPVKTIDAMAALRPDCLVGIPVQVLSLARNPAGKRIPRGVPGSVLLSTDYVPTGLVAAIKQTWGCRVYQHYGMTEMGYGGGVECDAHAGYHLREADLYVEIIDPQSGKPLPDGVTGEVVFTTLSRKAMPLVRYRTGDLARFHTSPCPCGSVLPRLGKIAGRMTNAADLGPGLHLSMAMLDEALFAIPELLDFQVELWPVNHRSVLSLTLDCPSDRFAETAGRVREVLADMPAVRSAVERGVLDIAPLRFSAAKWYTTGVAKRTLVDRRAEISTAGTATAAAAVIRRTPERAKT